MNNYNSPYLSIVTSSRNDEHGDNMFKRMQITLTSAVNQLEKYKLKAEIILTDYNPPPDRPLLKDAILWPNQTKYCTIRTIVVPPSIHRQYKDSDKMPFNGCVAQNVGLRRARGKFVLLSPIDILFSNELIEVIAGENLERDKIYRTDRYDVSRKALEITSLDEPLSFCSENIIEIHTRYGSIPVVRKKKHLTSKNLDFSVKSGKLPRLHINGPDLLLMSRESWHLLRGYPEMDTLGLHIDGLLCYMAYLSGIKEEILPEPCRIYHIDHDSRWRNIKPSLYEKILFCCFPDKFALRLRGLLGRIRNKLIPNILRKKSKLESIRISPISWADLLIIIHEMKNGKRPIAYNGNNWGLGEEELEEYFIVRAEWENQRVCLPGNWMEFKI